MHTRERTAHASECCHGPRFFPARSGMAAATVRVCALHNLSARLEIPHFFPAQVNLSKLSVRGAGRALVGRLPIHYVISSLSLQEASLQAYVEVHGLDVRRDASVAELTSAVAQ